MDRILAQPFMFFVLVSVIFILHIGAFVRIKHETALKKRGHPERRRRVRIFPDHRWSGRGRRSLDQPKDPG